MSRSPERDGQHELRSSKSLSKLDQIQQQASLDMGRGGGGSVVGGAEVGSVTSQKVLSMISKAHALYNGAHYQESLECCEAVYEIDAFRTDNLLLLGAVHFQLRNFSEAIFYNQQCIRVDPNFAEGYSNLGNALKELGDVKAASQFYLKAIKLKPRFCDAYNNLAGAYVQLGQTQEAMETYQMALVLNPALVDSHSNLGNLFKASGDLEGAKRCYLEAIRIKPDFPIAWSNLAGVFKEEGQFATAIAYYKEAIRLCPEFADAHSNLGNALKEQGLLQEAMACYQTAVSLRPDFAIAHGNLGGCYYDMGNIVAAIRSFKYAIQLEPNFPDAHNNLGNALRQENRIEEAVAAYRAALRLKPDHPHAYNNLGNAMKDSGMIKEAIHCYVTAIRLLPTFAAAHSNLGSVLKEQGKVNQAISHYQEAIAIDPLFAEAYSNLGNAYKEMGQLEEAIKCYSTAIKIRPVYADAFCNLAAAHKDGGNLVEASQLYQQALALQPNLNEAFANLVHTQAMLCDWSDRESNFARLGQQVQMQLLNRKHGDVPSVQPFHALSYPFSLAELLQIAQRYSLKARADVSLVETHFTFRPKPKSIRLRIGYVSSDFGNHPLSHLMQSVFGLHDRSRFEVFCYALSASDRSPWRRKIETEVEHFKDISQLQNGDAAQLIHNDGIHILINLNGFTKGARNEIFALHPAPLQVSFLGYCGTMGAEYIEYLVADSVVIPPELRGFYQEKIISLPHSYFVTDHKQSARSAIVTSDASTMPSRAQYGISEDKFVFCNFSQLYKIDPEMFDVWMRLLKRVENSVLWLLRFPAAAEANLLEEARKRGVREEQIVFSDVAPREEHLQRGFLADLFLDTSACNAHTTACDILWSGTPLITLQQEKMASRVASSLLIATGLSELVVTTLEDYEETAFALAKDVDSSQRLFGMRRHLEQCRDTCAAFDTERWTKNFEQGLSLAWRRMEKGLAPDTCIVEDADPVYVIQDADLFA